MAQVQEDTEDRVSTAVGDTCSVAGTDVSSADSAFEGSTISVRLDEASSKETTTPQQNRTQVANVNAKVQRLQPSTSSGSATGSPASVQNVRVVQSFPVGCVLPSKPLPTRVSSITDRPDAQSTPQSSTLGRDYATPGLPRRSTRSGSSDYVPLLLTDKLARRLSAKGSEAVRPSDSAANISSVSVRPTVSSCGDTGRSISSPSGSTSGPICTFSGGLLQHVPVLSSTPAERVKERTAASPVCLTPVRSSGRTATRSASYSDTDCVSVTLEMDTSDDREGLDNSSFALSTPMDVDGPLFTPRAPEGLGYAYESPKSALSSTAHHQELTTGARASDAGRRASTNTGAEDDNCTTIDVDMCVSGADDSVDSDTSFGVTVVEGDLPESDNPASEPGRRNSSGKCETAVTERDECPVSVEDPSISLMCTTGTQTDAPLTGQQISVSGDVL